MSPISKTCPACGQRLRIPEELGGVAMACPNCGRRIPSFFKLGAVGGVPVKTPTVSAPTLSSQRIVSPAPAVVQTQAPDQTQDATQNASDASLARMRLLSASGLTRYKLMQREG